MSRAVKNFRKSGTYESPTREEEDMMAYYMETLLRQCASQDEMTLDPSVYEYLYDHIPDWSALVEDKQFKMAQRLVDFYEISQRFPILDAVNTDEKVLHKFLARIRAIMWADEDTSAGVLYRSVMSYLNENIPNWAEPRHEKHEQKIQDVLMFIQLNGHMPKKL